MHGWLAEALGTRFGVAGTGGRAEARIQMQLRELVADDRRYTCRVYVLSAARLAVEDGAVAVYHPFANGRLYHMEGGEDEDAEEPEDEEEPGALRFAPEAGPALEVLVHGEDAAEGGVVVADLPLDPEERRVAPAGRRPEEIRVAALHGNDAAPQVHGRVAPRAEQLHFPDDVQAVVCELLCDLRLPTTTDTLARRKLEKYKKEPRKVLKALEARRCGARHEAFGVAPPTPPPVRKEGRVRLNLAAETVNCKSGKRSRGAARLLVVDRADDVTKLLAKAKTLLKTKRAPRVAYVADTGLELRDTRGVEDGTLVLSLIHI